MMIRKMKMSKAFFLILISGFLLSMKISSTTLNDITSNSKKLKTISLSFLPLFKNENLVLNDKIYENESSQKFSIETLKFYISKIKFLKFLLPQNQSFIFLLGNPLLKSVSLTSLHSKSNFDNASANSFMWKNFPLLPYAIKIFI